MLTKYKVAGCIALVLYIFLFGAGLVVDSAPYRAALRNAAFDPVAFIIVVFAYTPTNTAFLAILAGLIAGCASRVTYHHYLYPPERPGNHHGKELTQSVIYRTESPFASMFRSLVVYFAFLAGILITTVDQFTTTTQDQYIRLAAAVSFFSFIVGYDPSLFQSILSRVRMPLKGAATARKSA